MPALPPQHGDPESVGSKDARDVELPALTSSEQALDNGTMTGSKFTAAENKRVLRKIDTWLMPTMCIVYTLQYIDKSAMSYAAVFTFRQDRNLTGPDYRWLGTVFYLGYTFFEFPGSYLMQKVPTNIFMGILVIIWGGLVMAMSGPQGFAGLAAVRTLLGAAESLITPGFALITARFYLRREQPFRVGIWYSCNGIGSILGGLMGYGSGRIDIPSLPNWAWIFVLNGLITVLAGFVFLMICPNSPENARFLTPRERLIAVERVRSNQASLHSKEIKWKQVREALNPFEDPQGWLMFFATFTLTVPNGGLGNFLHLILQAYGFNAFKAILLGIPSGVVHVAVVLSTTYIARRFDRMRIFVGIGGIAFSLLGIVIQYCTDKNGARLFGYYLIVCFIAALAQLFAMPAANVNGYSKRITVQAMVFIAYGSGNALGPTFWKPRQTPPYRDGLLACIICFSCSICFMLGLRLHYVRENRRRDRAQPSSPTRTEADFADITDVQNRNFRYQL